MTATPQDRVQVRDTAQRALDAAVLACRANPSPENKEANLAAARVYMDAAHAVIADEMIEMQRHPTACGPSVLCCPDWPILHVHARSCRQGGRTDGRP